MVFFLGDWSEENDLKCVCVLDMVFGDPCVADDDGACFLAWTNNRFVVPRKVVCLRHNSFELGVVGFVLVFLHLRIKSLKGYTTFDLIRFDLLRDAQFTRRN